MEVCNLIEIHTRDELYTWFLKNHDREKSFWIRVNRSKRPYPNIIEYADAVEVALCFGWIDSTIKHIDDGSPVQHFTPRRKGSNWSRKNIERCRRLTESGEMTSAGKAAMPYDFTSEQPGS